MALSREQRLAILSRQLVAAQFEQVLYLAGAPREHLSARHVPQSSRAIELLIWIEANEANDALDALLESALAPPRSINAPNSQNSDSLAQAACRPDPERDHRLIQDLKSGNSPRVCRAIQILSRSPNPWLVDALQSLIIGDDEMVAHDAIIALSRVGNRTASRSIIGGLRSNIQRTRFDAAYILGEMALDGTLQDTDAAFTALLQRLEVLDEHQDIRYNALHSIVKIGGRRAVDVCLGILRHEKQEWYLIAGALQGPSSYWNTKEINHSRSAELFLHFRRSLSQIINTWSLSTCDHVLLVDSLFRAGILDEDLRMNINNRIHELADC